MATAKPQLKKVKRGPAAPSSMSSGRTMKMADPHCDICQVPNHPINWAFNCEHNPYVTEREVPVREPIIEVNEETGEKLITGEKTKLVLEESPNFTQIPMGKRYDNGNAFRIARELGMKMPEELGFAPFCQYRDCWSQDLKVKTAMYGSYCSEAHAKLVMAEELEIFLDVTDEKRRAQQLAGINVA